MNVRCIAIPCGRDEAIFTEVYGMENRAENLETIEKLNQRIAKQEQQIAELTAMLKWYEEQNRLAKQKRFGASSEKTSPDQLELNLFLRSRGACVA